MLSNGSQKDFQTLNLEICSYSKIKRFAQMPTTTHKKCDNLLYFFFTLDWNLTFQ